MSILFNPITQSWQDERMFSWRSVSTSSLSHYEQYCSFFPWPSGHPGGGSHLSISHCCPGQLLWSNVHPGRHLRWRQMLLHKPASSQCGFYNIKQIVFLCWCSASLQRKPHCTGTRSDIVRGVGLLCLYEWVDVYSLNLALPPFTHVPFCLLPYFYEIKAAWVRLDLIIIA